MSYTQKKLSEVELLTEVPENATVFAEVNGEIKRVPGKGLGGSGNGIVLVMDDASAQTLSAAPVYTFTANMDFVDAMEAFRAYEITGAVVYILNSNTSPNTLDTLDTIVEEEYSYMMDVTTVTDGTANFGVDCLVFMTMMSQMEIYWTANGISTEIPSSPK